ncbi:MAG: aconitase family protein [Bacteroidota bacterium]
MTIIEQIIAKHSSQQSVKPGDIVDVVIDTRAARDFGGANVVKNLIDNGLTVADPKKTIFTFDCNPGGSDQKYAANQHYCRQYARETGIRVYDVDAGIGTHLAIDNGLSWPGSTFVSTDSHANIMGAICAFGQGMGDQDIAAAWAKGAVWFKVPGSVKINLTGKKPASVTAKDVVLNLLSIFGANKLLGYSVEIYGEETEKFTLADRITIASMGTEMGAIIILFPTSSSLLQELKLITGKDYQAVTADADATYEKTFDIDMTRFVTMVAKPGHPHDDTSIETVRNQKIDSGFIGSCTNGRIEDLRAAAVVLRGRKVAPGVVLKIVPATDAIWTQAMDEGIIQTFKEAGVMVSNAGCAGCAAGQVGQCTEGWGGAGHRGGEAVRRDQRLGRQEGQAGEGSRHHDCGGRWQRDPGVAAGLQGEGVGHAGAAPIGRHHHGLAERPPGAGRTERRPGDRRGHRDLTAVSVRDRAGQRHGPSEEARWGRSGGE